MMNKVSVAPLPPSQVAMAAAFVAMVRPEQSPPQWEAWLRQPEHTLIGLSDDGRLLGVLTLAAAAVSLAGQWIPSADIVLLVLQPGASRSLLLMAAVDAARQWAVAQDRALLRADETDCGALTGHGFVAAGPVTTLVVPPADLPVAPRHGALRPGRPDDLARLAALHDRRALELTG
ncbi:MAG: hypothetical protein H7338_03360, partial [Candidatus Sericytochromatia bacterium]|nr:hypothetical protein [Candidatus Sericytochromatia bacterium]